MDPRSYDNQVGHVYHEQDYSVDSLKRRSYQNSYENDNMEWDSTFEGQEYHENDSRLQYNDRDNDYSRDAYADRYSDDRRHRKDFEDYEDRKPRDRNRDDMRDREIDRELEKVRYNDRPERSEQGRLWDRIGATRSRERERDRSWERGKERGRDRGRDRDRDRDRDGDRDRERERDRDREKDSYKDRARDRDKDRELYRERDRDRRRDDRSDRDRDYDERYSRDRRKVSADKERDHEKEKIAPSAHIMMRGSPSALTKEDEIAEELHQEGLEYQDIKIVRNRHGESRGFGFVDFYDVATSEKWMALTKGVVYIGDYRVSLEYSKTRAPPSAYHQIDVDWYCSKCRTLNYASRKRVTCFSCGEHRKDYPPEGHDDYDYDENGHSKDAPISAPPCNVLMMRGLDTNTTEETIRNHLVELTSVPIYDVRLIKDKVTGISRGFCFIELGSTEDATSLLEKIQQCDPAYFIEGRRVSVGYARNTPHPPPSKGKQGQDSRSRVGTSQSQSSKNVNIASIAIAQAQAAQLQGQSADYNYQTQQPQQYAQAVSGSQQATDSNQLSTQPAIQTIQATQQQQQQVTAQPVQQQFVQQQQQQQQQQQAQSQYAQRQHAFDNYTYDPNTGYYYDPTTGLYYDANTGYYYNGTTGRFLHWDAQKQQYFIVNQDGSLSSMDNEGNPIPTSGTGSEKVKSKPTGSNARKIAKDMERWAKKMNEAKVAKSNAARKAQLLQQEQEAKEEAIRQQIQNEILQNVTKSIPDAVKITSKTLFAADDDDNSQSLAALIAAKTEAKGLPSSLVAEYGDDSDDDQTERHIDWDKLTCLLCKRQFPNKDILTKHQQMSDLHKQNLEKFKQKQKS